MKISSGIRLLVLSGILSLGLLPGCGSSTSKNTASTTENVFYSHAILPATDGTIWGSGYNGYGQLGDGTLGNTFWFFPISKSPELGGGSLKVSGYATGANHGLAFGNNSTLWVWGSNFQGRLGVGAISGLNLPNSGGTAYSAYALPMYMKNSVRSVAAGWKHSLAVIGDRVWSWGDNTYGQMGLGGSGLSSSATLVTEYDFPVATSVNNATQVAAGGSHSLALTVDRTTNVSRVFAWGYNLYGQTGQADLAYNTYYPSEVTTLNSGNLTGGDHVTAIAAAGSYSLALVQPTGKVYAWGYNGYGQLGQNTTSLYATVDTIIPHPVQQKDGAAVTGVTKISAGQLHCLAMFTGTDGKGHVLSWGDNEKGQLGILDDSLVSNSKMQNIAKITFFNAYASQATVFDSLIQTSTNGVTDIYAFGNASFVKIDNVWYGVGDNNWGQLGLEVPTTSVSYVLDPSRTGARLIP